MPATPPHTAKELWRRPAAGGYSEIAVSGDGVVTMELRSGVDFVVALDPSSGRELWSARVGTLVGIGPHLLLLGQTSGDLRIVRASPAGFTETFRTRVFTPEVTSVTGPSFVDGRLYVRNIKEMAAFELGG
ncbi:MAG: hypothetical protein ACRD1S_05395 [Vicinamibacterales bacterium]